MPLLMFMTPWVIFAVSCVVSLRTALAFNRELIERGYEEGSPWSGRFWAYLRRYDERSLERKRLAALAANAIGIASLLWLTTR